MENYIDHPLYGMRILHYSAPVKFSPDGTFLHQSDSNYKVLEKTINFLPFCHHYVIVPKINKLDGYDQRKNVTYIPFEYVKNAVVNRTHYDFLAFRKYIDLRQIDFDFIFNHQSEVMLDIMTSLSEKRYGEIVDRFLFFHWVDNPSSRGSSQVPPTFMRQLEAINIADKAFFHTEQAPLYYEKNFRKDMVVGLNIDNLMKKVECMPLSSDDFPPSEPISDFPTNKKILVFNHRWNKSTGWDMMMEYTENLRNSGEYIVWCTDIRAPKELIARNLKFSQYRYLIENSLASVCFVSGYATWNLSSQDGVRLNKPVIVYRHPTLERILGVDYPFFFKTKDEFEQLVKTVPPMFKWKLADFETQFKQNLHNAMNETFYSKTIQDTKYGNDWIYYILNGIGYKKDIISQTSDVMSENSAWQWTRRWLLQHGVKDNPDSRFTNYFIQEKDKDKFGEMIKDVKVHIKPFTSTIAMESKKSIKFFEL